MKTKELKAVTWNDAEILLVAFAQEQAAVRRIETDLERDLARVVQNYAEKLQKAEASRDETAAALRKFAQAHRREFVAKEEGGEGRVREIHGVLYGYRLAPPKVRIPKKRVEDARRWLEEYGGDTYVRRPPEIARDRLKADLVDAQARQDKAFLERFAAHHITLEQDEDFVLETLSAS